VQAAEVGADHVTLVWDDTSRTETEFDIYRSPQGANTWSEVGRVTADVTTFTDATVLPATDYDYKVSAHNQVGDTDSAPPLSVTTGSTGTAPAVPTNLREDSSTTTYNQIGIAWDPVTSPSGVTYRVYRRVGNSGSFTLLTPNPISAVTGRVKPATSGRVENRPF
jgi:fibronectin type 3 domain-containing protein